MGTIGTLLRYPGGKSRAVKYLGPLLSRLAGNTLVSPFFGGGAIEIYLANQGLRVYGYDYLDLLVEFWQEVLDHPGEVASHAFSHLTRGFGQEEFKILQDMIYDLPSKSRRAAAFYVLNRTSFSGTTLSGGFTKGNPRFKLSSIRSVASFHCPNLTVDYADFRNSISFHKDTFLYCDPPYMLKQDKRNLYGKRGDLHKEFEHEALFRLLSKRDRWLLSYNDCEEVREMYRDFNPIKLNWSYGMSTNKESKELLIMSRDIKIEKGQYWDVQGNTSVFLDQQE